MPMVIILLGFVPHLGGAPIKWDLKVLQFM